MLTFSPKTVTKDLLADLSDRSKSVLVDRYGLSSRGEERTLDAIGKEYKITRERVRQIENNGLALTRESDAYAAHSDKWDAIKVHLQQLGSTLAEHTIVAELVKNQAERKHLVFLLNVGRHFKFRRETSDFHARWHIDESLTDKIERALASLYGETQAEILTPEEDFFRLFVKYLREGGVKENRTEILMRWLSISKRMARNPLGEWGRADSPQVTVRNTRDFAYLTLKRHGSPMHFTEVAGQIENLFDRETHAATTHNELIKDERFVLVGRGIYALKEWGYAPGIVRDVIKSILVREGPLTRQDIVERVKRERYVKDATIAVNLQSGVFRKDTSGRYSVVEL